VAIQQAYNKSLADEEEKTELLLLGLCAVGTELDAHRALPYKYIIYCNSQAHFNIIWNVYLFFVLGNP